MKSFRIIVPAVCMLILTGMLSAPVSAQQVETQNMELNRQVDYSAFVIALEQAGVTYQKVKSEANSSAWIIPWKVGEQQVNINAMANGDVISLIMVAGPKPKELSKDFLTKITELNTRYFFVKFAMDASNIYIRIDTLNNAVNGPILANYIGRLARTYEQEIPKLLSGAAESK